MEVFLGIGLRWVIRIITVCVIALVSVLHFFGFGALQYLYESNILFFIVIVGLFTFARRNSSTVRWFIRFLTLGIFENAIILQYFDVPAYQWLWNTKWFFAPCILFILTFAGRAPHKVLIEMPELPELPIHQKEREK